MSVLDQLLQHDPVMEAVRDAISYREKRTTRTGFIDICCPMCVQRGQARPDKKFRCGIMLTNGVGVNCFNCGLKIRWIKGQRIPFTLKSLMLELGVLQSDLKRINYWADQVHSLISHSPEIQEQYQLYILPDYPSVRLPQSARSLQHWAEMECTDPDFLEVASYLLSRGDAVVQATTYYWCPDNNLRHRVIIPCFHDGRLVGWTARAVSKEIEPRYHKETPANLLFNSRYLTIPNRKYVFIVEGVFDALAIDGVAALGASLNSQQISWIKNSGKQPIVVPDRDTSGIRLAETAIEQEWPVATLVYGHNRWWEDDIKDAADAAKRYGKLYTVKSILESMTFDKNLIKQRTRFLAT